MDKEVSENELEKDGELTLYQGEPFNGVSVRYRDDNGKVFSETHYKSGMKHGLHIVFNDYGHRVIKDRYKEGKLQDHGEILFKFLFCIYLASFASLFLFPIEISYIPNSIIHFVLLIPSLFLGGAVVMWRIYEFQELFDLEKNPHYVSFFEFSKSYRYKILSLTSEFVLYSFLSYGGSCILFFQIKALVEFIFTS